jgi:hypothetical protein
MARIFWNPLAGLISLGILAILPIDMEMSSVLMPDAIAAFWGNLGVLITILAMNRARLIQSAALAVSAGMLFALSWLCKESVVYLAPAAGILILFLYPGNKLKVKICTLISLGLTVMCVLILEGLSYRALTGDPYFRLHMIEKNYQQCAVWFFDQSSPYFGWEEGGRKAALLKRLFVSGPKSILLGASWSALPAFALVGVAWAVVFRHRSFAIPATWLVVLLAMFNFMSSSFQSYKPLVTIDHHLYPILFPSALVFAGLLANLLATDNETNAHHDGVFWACLLLMLYCVCCVRQWPHLFTCKPESAERAVAARLGEKDVIYSDYRSVSSLVFFRSGSLLSSSDNTLPYESVDPDKMVKGACVLVDRKMSDFLAFSYKYRPPSFVTAPPETWNRIWTDKEAVLYQVQSR